MTPEPPRPEDPMTTLLRQKQATVARLEAELFRLTAERDAERARAEERDEALARWGIFASKTSLTPADADRVLAALRATQGGQE